MNRPDDPPSDLAWKTPDAEEPSRTAALFALPAPLAVIELGRWLQGIPDGPTRAAYVRRQLRAAPILPLVRVIACAQREAASGELAARICMDAIGRVLQGEVGDADWRRAVWQGAQDLVEPGVALLFSTAPSPSGQPLGKAPKGSLAAEGETLGRRKQLARTARGDLLDKLLHDPHPDVVRNALLNPTMSETLAVRLAARRPVAAAVLEVLAQSRFVTRLPVKRALAMNPHCPPQIACVQLAALPRSDLLVVAHTELLASPVREAARILLEFKPPKHPGEPG